MQQLRNEVSCEKTFFFFFSFEKKKSVKWLKALLSLIKYNYLHSKWESSIWVNII